MPQEELHKHGLWFFGVILGLAIKEALIDVFPHILNPPLGESVRVAVEGCRLLIFLFLCIRFYLGAVVFFQANYGSEKVDENLSQRSFGRHFSFGFIHFLLFFGLALSIDINHTPQFWFPLLIAMILSYDCLWYFMGRKFDKESMIQMWMIINLVTLALSLPTYFIIRHIYGMPLLAELLAYIPLFIISLVDIAEVTTKREHFSNLLRYLGNKFLKLATRNRSSGMPTPTRKDESPSKDADGKGMIYGVSINYFPQYTEDELKKQGYTDGQIIILREVLKSHGLTMQSKVR